MKTMICLLLIALLLGVHHYAMATTSFYVVTAANCEVADNYLPAFESHFCSHLKKEFPCVDILTSSEVRTMLDFERQSQLLGNAPRLSLTHLADGMDGDYLVSLKVKLLQGNIYIDAFCLRKVGNKVVSRLFIEAPSGSEGMAAIEKASRQLVEGLKKQEVCPFKGPINISVKTERSDKRVELNAVYCNGVDGTYRREESITSNSLANWKLNKTRRNSTSGSLSYTMFEEMVVEEQDPCALCPSGKRGVRILSERTEKRADINGLSSESVDEGVPVNDARTEIVFFDNGTYTVKVRAASTQGNLRLKTDRSIEGACEKSNTSNHVDKKADVPLDEVFGPFQGTSLDNVLSERKTIVREDPETKEKTTISFDFILTKE